MLFESTPENFYDEDGSEGNTIPSTYGSMHDVFACMIKVVDEHVKQYGNTNTELREKGSQLIQHIRQAKEISGRIFEIAELE